MMVVAAVNNRQSAESLTLIAKAAIERGDNLHLWVHV